MKILVGLGNPGKKYEQTRHNAGHLLADLLSDYLTKKSSTRAENWTESKKGNLLYKWFEKENLKIETIKTQSFMNDSGNVLKYILKKHPEVGMDDLFIAHDDLDIPLGNYKVQKGRGPKDHNGLNDIYKKTGRRNFWHVRIGVDSRTKESRIEGEDYVLHPFSEKEFGLLTEVLAKIVQELNDSHLK